MAMPGGSMYMPNQMQMVGNYAGFMIDEAQHSLQTLQSKMQAQIKDMQRQAEAAANGEGATGIFSPAAGGGSSAAGVWQDLMPSLNIQM